MTDPEPQVPAQKPLRVVVREMRDDDERFVINSWYRSWRNSPDTRRESNRGYHAIFEDLVMRGVLTDDRSRVQMAVSEDDLSEIFGWMCYEPGPVPVVHYVNVRGSRRETCEPLRRRGIMRMLMALAGVRDRLAYTFRPAERAHQRDNTHAGVEDALLKVAREAGVAAVRTPVRDWLGRQQPSAEPRT